MSPTQPSEQRECRCFCHWPAGSEPKNVDHKCEHCFPEPSPEQERNFMTKEELIAEFEKEFPLKIPLGIAGYSGTKRNIVARKDIEAFLLKAFDAGVESERERKKELLESLHTDLMRKVKVLTTETDKETWIEQTHLRGELEKLDKIMGNDYSPLSEKCLTEDV